MSSRLRLFLLMLLAGGPFMSAAAFADSGSAPPAVAILVDVQKVLDKSIAAKGVQKQLDSERSHFQSETEKEENQLRQAEQDLGKAHDQLSADAYSEREQQLRQRFIVEERHVETRRKILEQSFTDAMNVVRDNLVTIVQAAAQEKDANLVIVKQQVLWADKTLDITDEVLARLNKTLPQVAVKTPAEEKVP